MKPAGGAEAAHPLPIAQNPSVCQDRRASLQRNGSQRFHRLDASLSRGQGGVVRKRSSDRFGWSAPRLRAQCVHHSMNSTQSFSNRSELSCVVIGAGPGGIVATKELLEQGETDVICLEKSDRLGGIFSGAYDSLTLTSSCAYSMFSDHWIGDGNEHHFWTKAEVVDYWTAYARRFGAAAPGSLGGARPAPPAVDVPRLKMLTLPSESKPAR